MSLWYLFYLLLPITLYLLKGSISLLIDDFKGVWYQKDRTVDALIFYMFLVVNVTIILFPLVVTHVI